MKQKKKKARKAVSYEKTTIPYKDQNVVQGHVYELQRFSVSTWY
jgi:hypothetical protein